MRAAIFAVTDKGLELAEKISSNIGGKIFIKGRDFDKLKIFVGEVFKSFDALIFICAAGIVVRVIAPLIVSKLSDPAVIVIDERGKNVISLLSGHVGGANDLTLKISRAINANPVITTATDVEEKFSADGLANRLGLRPEPKEMIQAINTAILRGEEVFLTAGNARLNLFPQKLIAGIGCRRGTSAAEISRAITAACDLINQPPQRINLLASVDVKRDEIGLLDFAKTFGLEIKFFGVDELAKKISEYKLEESDFVKKIIGVGNICEASALCCVGGAKFALPKTKFRGVTVALIWEK